MRCAKKKPTDDLNGCLIGAWEVISVFLPYNGLRLYGRIDKACGVFMIATQFLHICFIPVIPVRSYVVLRDSTGKEYGVRIRPNLKSIFFAYFRLLTLYLAVINFLVGLVIYFDNTLWSMQTDIWYMIGIALGFLALHITSRKLRFINYASFNKAIYIATKADLPKQVIALLKVNYYKANDDDKRVASLPATPLCVYAVELKNEI